MLRTPNPTFGCVSGKGGRGNQNSEYIVSVSALLRRGVAPGRSGIQRAPSDDRLTSLLLLMKAFPASSFSPQLGYLAHSSRCQCRKL